MRHLLDILHHDIQSPSDASTFCVHSTKRQIEKDPFLQDVPRFCLDVPSDLEPFGKGNHLAISTPLHRSPTSHSSYSLRGEIENGPLRYSQTKHSSHALDIGMEAGLFKFDSASHSSHLLDKLMADGSFDFNLARYSSDVMDRDTEDCLLQDRPISHTSRVMDRETEDGLLQDSPVSHGSGVLDGGTEDGPMKSSPTNYRSHVLDRETEEGQEEPKIREDLSPGSSHNHLTPEDNEALNFTEGDGELSRELEELGSNMEALHVSETTPRTKKDEQDFSIFSDDEFWQRYYGVAEMQSTKHCTESLISFGVCLTNMAISFSHSFFSRDSLIDSHNHSVGSYQTHYKLSTQCLNATTQIYCTWINICKCESIVFQEIVVFL